MPHISARLDCSIFFIIICDFYSVYNSLCCCNLIRSHYQEQVFRSKNTVFCNNVQNGMFCKKGLGKINKISYRFVFSISPETSKFKAVTGLTLFILGCSCIFNSVESCTIRVILCICTV